MTGVQRRAKVLTFVGNYLPGYKAGGILRSLVNAVDHLSPEFDFRVVTRDRDLGDSDPYPGVSFNKWQRVGEAEVLYFQPEKGIGFDAIRRLIADTPHDVVYLNSFFDRFTIMVLLIRRCYAGRFRSVIVAPRGEFAWGALGQKRLKKVLFIRAAKAIGLYRGVTWHASSAFEAEDIRNVMGVELGAIHTALDLPTMGKELPMSSEEDARELEELRVVFLSRIAPVKNLKYALEILARVRVPVSFHIYGPIEAHEYWQECLRLMQVLPENVKVEYAGSVHPRDVVAVFSRYDLFLFPTTGENYGHVIAEALTSGTPVLISNETPWRDLEADGLGWDLDLADISGFAARIEALAREGCQERCVRREAIRQRVHWRLLDPERLEANRELFRAASQKGAPEKGVHVAS